MALLVLMGDVFKLELTNTSLEEYNKKRRLFDKREFNDRNSYSEPFFIEKTLRFNNYEDLLNNFLRYKVLKRISYFSKEEGRIKNYSRDKFSQIATDKHNYKRLIDDIKPLDFQVDHVKKMGSLEIQLKTEKSLGLKTKENPSYYQRHLKLKFEQTKDGEILLYRLRYRPSFNFCENSVIKLKSENDRDFFVPKDSFIFSLYKNLEDMFPCGYLDNFK